MADVENLLMECGEVALEGAVRFKELNKKASREPLDCFIRRVTSSLGLDSSTVQIAIFTLVRAVKRGLRVKKGRLQWALLPCLMLAEKYNEDQENAVESYSLVSAMPIKDLIHLEEQLFVLLDFTIIAPTLSDTTHAGSQRVFVYY